MRDISSWSLSLGRWLRVHVRVHCLLVAVAVFAVYLSTSHAGQETPGYGVLGVVILFLSLLAHELGHCLAAMRVGGNPEQIVIGPLGGLAQVEVPRESRPELITAVAGPLVNLGILLLLLPLVVGAQVGLSGLLSPLEPSDLIEGSTWIVAAKMAFWINWLLLVVNLLPAIPFDGARVLRTMLSPGLDYRTAGQVVVRASKLTALGICVLAWLMRDVRSAEVLPAWVPLMLVAVFVYFSAAHEGARLDDGDWDEELFNYDFSQGYTSLERTSEPRRSGRSILRWLRNRRELRQRRRQFREQDEERQVDEILTRLHETGMGSLTAKQRALLQRVSARYRNRQRNF